MKFKTFKTRRTIVAVAVVGAIAAGGAAYTNSLGGGSVTDSSAAFGTLTVTGDVLSSVGYTMSGADITAVNLTFASTVTNAQLQVGLGSTGGLATTALALCSTPVTSITAATPVTCTLSTPVLASAAQDLAVAVNSTQ